MSYPADRSRRTTLAGRLARLGFADAARAERVVGELRLDDHLIGVLGDAADPDLALTGLARLLPSGDAAAPGLRPALQAEPPFARRLTAVLGASAALADHLARHPGDWRVLHGAGALQRPTAAELRAALLRAVGAVPGDAEPHAAPAPGTDPAVALCATYRRALLHLAARDLTGAVTVDEAAAELADLGAAALEAALAVARSQLPAEAAAARLAVIGMGKCGGRELNYASDVDVIFVGEPAPGQPEDAALRTATRLIGLGPGLTPAGDDVMAGTIAGLVLLGHPSAERFAAAVYSLAAGRTTELSRALLRHAAAGRVSGEYAAVLHGLVGERPLAPAVAQLLATGSTSGRAMALGLCTAIDLVDRTTRH